MPLKATEGVTETVPSTVLVVVSVKVTVPVGPTLVEVIPVSAEVVSEAFRFTVAPELTKVAPVVKVGVTASWLTLMVVVAEEAGYVESPE